MLVDHYLEGTSQIRSPNYLRLQSYMCFPESKPHQRQWDLLQSRCAQVQPTRLFTSQCSIVFCTSQLPCRFLKRSRFTWHKCLCESSGRIAAPIPLRAIELSSTRENSATVWQRLFVAAGSQLQNIFPQLITTRSKHLAIPLHIFPAPQIQQTLRVLGYLTYLKLPFLPTPLILWSPQSREFDQKEASHHHPFPIRHKIIGFEWFSVKQHFPSLVHS